VAGGSVCAPGPSGLTAGTAVAAGPWGGYSNGRIPLDRLCRTTFDARALARCDAAAALDRLDTVYRARFGRHLSITDSYRDYAVQVACRARKGNLCADPGTSNHGWGLAVDLGGGVQAFGTPQHAWMAAHAGRYGWTHPAWAQAGGSKREPWHWEYTGTSTGSRGGGA
jgi:LAS superfamily LD-carboxypeptidase LdcB